MTFTDLAKSYVRTVVPVVVGLVVSLALRAGVDLHGYAPEITAVVTAAYYAAARAAEHYLDPRFGWLLGVAAAPRYTHPAKTTQWLAQNPDEGLVWSPRYGKQAKKAAPKDRGETFIWFVLVVLAACLGGLLAHLILRAM